MPQKTETGTNLGQTKIIPQITQMGQKMFKQMDFMLCGQITSSDQHKHRHQQGVTHQTKQNKTHTHTPNIYTQNKPQMVKNTPHPHTPLKTHTAI